MFQFYLKYDSTYKFGTFQQLLLREVLKNLLRLRD